MGERTGGDGIGNDPYLLGLPNTGYIVRFSKELGVTESGSINEIDKTEPDIYSDATKMVTLSGDKIIWDGDACIYTVINDLGL